MRVESIDGLPQLPPDDGPVSLQAIDTHAVEVLIVGGGPAGLSAAIELGQHGVETLIVDDKDRLGGKLVLQTHKFFGSVADSYAGTRGFEIGQILADRLEQYPCVDVWLNTTVVGVFSDGFVGAVTGRQYRKIVPQKLLVATGAREKMLSFPGNTLPGEISISPRIWRMPRMNCMQTSRSAAFTSPSGAPHGATLPSSRLKSSGTGSVPSG